MNIFVYLIKLQVGSWTDMVSSLNERRISC